MMMKKMVLPILLALTLFVAACAPQATPESAPTQVPTEVPAETEAPVPTEEVLPDTSEQTIVDIAAADERFSTLVGAVQSAGLVDTLAGEGPFTVFAPTNDAFAALPEGTLESLSTEELTNILLYHVIPGKVMAEDAVQLDGQSAGAALEDAQISISVRDGNVYLNDDVQVIITDIEASNGVIHVIDGVLLPPAGEEEAMAEEMPGIIDIAATDGRFTTLVGALQSTGLAEALQAEGPFTVFAPTDEAFAALPDGTLESLSAEDLANILLYHVVDGKVMAADVAKLDGQNVETLSGMPVEVNLDGNAVMINQAQVAIADIEASNGVIHVIDSVLLPPAEDEMSMGQTIVDIAAADERFSTLVGAVQSAGLVDTLAGEGPFTVFAPTDDAFAALPEGTLESLSTEDLTTILLYHVVPGNVMAADVVDLDGQSVDTALEGAQISISVRDGNVYLNDDVQVIITDIEAANGVIHVIDGVLLPPQ